MSLLPSKPHPGRDRERASLVVSAARDARTAVVPELDLVPVIEAWTLDREALDLAIRLLAFAQPSLGGHDLGRDRRADELRRAAVLDVADEARDELYAAHGIRKRRVGIGAADVETPGDPWRHHAAEPSSVSLVEGFDLRVDDLALVEGRVGRT